MPLDNPESNEQLYANTIPAAVRRQSERADQLAREHGLANAPGGDPAASPVAETPPAAAEGAPPVAAAPAVVDPLPLPGPPAASAPPVEDWQQKYRTLQGKYDREVPSLHDRIASLERLLSTMQEAPAAAPPASPPVETAPVAPPQADIEAYGQDLIDAVHRWVMPVVEGRLAQFEKRLGEVSTRTAQTSQETRQASVQAALDADPELAGKWREINHDPEFLAWLNQADPFAGVQRSQLLNEAYGRGDAVRTARFFKAFLTEHTAVTPAPAASDAQTPAPEPAADRPTLESMAAPGRAPVGPPAGGAPAEKRVWTNREIASFYKDCTDGKFAGRDAERLRFEQDIISAASEGRVRNVR